jgi:hypothetical protein
VDNFRLIHVTEKKAAGVKGNMVFVKNLFSDS